MADKLSSALLAKSSVSRNVEIGDQKVSAVIIRGGKEVKTPTVNVDRVTDFVDNLKPVPRPATPRLVQQSIAPGTFVAAGTPVDLVFVPPADINVGILDGVHIGARDKSILEILGVLDDSGIDTIVAKGDPAALTEAEKNAVTSSLAQRGVQVDDSQPDASFDRAYKTLQDVRAFR